MLLGSMVRVDGSVSMVPKGAGLNTSIEKRAQELFEAAIDLDPHARQAFLQHASEGDPALRASVEDLLSAYERSEAYFADLSNRLGLRQWPPVDDEPVTSPDEAADGNGIAGGQTLGSWTLTHRLGVGGMGEVWCAQRNDGRFEGRVAVKFLSISNQMAAERFLREGRYLARLDHPNIARLIDAGVGPGGRPYLVMEFVEGERIDQYADRRALTVEQRVRLFVQVVDAIAHAHRHLIVHRDVKPNNVAVTADGAVKVFDFGISKLLGENDVLPTGELTGQFGLALTPQYAAPEQIEGTEVTTATDVFSLGMLLWSLLTDVTPRSLAQVSTLAELRAVATKDPDSVADTVTRDADASILRERASRRGVSSADFLRTLRGDLDSILRKATAVDVRERYASATEFADELARYLRDEPVIARAPSAGYRLSKFISRHRGGVAAGVLTMLAIVSALVVALWQGAEARRQRDFAYAQQARAQATHEFMSFLISDVGMEGRPVTLEDILGRAETMLQRQSGAVANANAPIFYEIATAHFSLGGLEKMLALLADAERAARAAGDNDMLSATLCTVSRATLRSDPAAARKNFREALQIYQTLPVRSAESLASCERARAVLQESDGDPVLAIGTLRAAITILQRDYPGLRPKLNLLNELSRVHYDRLDFDAALDVNEQILAAMRQAGLDRNAGYAVNLMNRSALLQSMGEIVAANKVQRDIYDNLRHLKVAVGFERPLATSYLRLARYDEALRLLQENETQTRASKDAFAIGESLILQARALLFAGQLAAVEPRLEEAQRLLSAEPNRNRRVLNTIELTRCQLAQRRGQLAEARRRTAALLETLGAAGNTRSPLLIQLRRLAAEVELESGDVAAARSHAEQAVALAMALARDPRRSADVGQSKLLLAKVSLAAGDPATARTDLDIAVAALTEGLGGSHPETIMAIGLRDKISRDADPH
jgi:eukaryotic-like serine/threonine-protein kinase